MDNLKLFIGDVKNLSLEKLTKNSYVSEKMGDKHFLYKNNERKESDWYLSVFVKKEFGKTSIYILGSIRKWYYGKYTFKNLSFSDYEKCIELIALRLNLSENEIWGAKLYKAEISLTIKVPPNYAYILKSLVDYKSFEVMRVGHSYLNFMGESKKMKFYNAGKLVWKKKNIKKSVIEKIERKHFVIFRFEIKITDINDIDKEMSRMIQTLGLILSNWSSIYALLRKSLTEIKCYGVPSDLKYNLHDKKASDYYTFLMISGILNNGIENCFEALKLLKPGNERHRAKKKLLSIMDRAKFPITDSVVMINAFDKSLKGIL